MAHRDADVCEMQLNGVSEELSLLLLDFDTDMVKERPGKGDATCSVSSSVLSNYLLHVIIEIVYITEW